MGRINEGIIHRAKLSGNAFFKDKNIVAVLLCSILGGIAGLSDAFLYAYLPVNAQALGLTSTMVGVLLSANRFIRLIINRWVASWAQIMGVKKLFILGIAVTFLVCLLYALHGHFLIWLLARFLWGTCFSIIRFSRLQYSIACTQMGSAMGWSKSLNEVIGIFSYLLGPILVLNYGGSGTFIIYALVLVLLIPVFYYLPNLKIQEQKIRAFSFKMPGSVDAWAFLISFFVDGMLIIGISKIIGMDAHKGELLLFTSFYIAIRKGISIVLSPFIGRLVDRLPYVQSLLICAGFISVAFVCLCLGLQNIGLTLAFIGSGFSHTLIPILSVKSVPKNQNFEAITKMANSRDLGSAFGALIGLDILIHINQNLTFGVLAILINVPVYKIYQTLVLKKYRA